MRHPNRTYTASRRLHLVAIASAASILCLAGCADELGGTYQGTANEGGSVHIEVRATGARAVNDIGPRRHDDESVTVIRDGQNVSVEFEGCKLHGKLTGPDTALVKNRCPVKVGAWEGELPLSGTVQATAKRRVSLDVVGNEEANGTNVSYTYAFRGESK